MTTTTQARIAITTLFVVMSIAGGVAIYLGWSRESIPIGVGRAILFVVIMASVCLAGYVLYVKQYDSKLIESIPEGVEFELSPKYWPALKFGITVQIIIGVL